MITTLFNFLIQAGPIWVNICIILTIILMALALIGGLITGLATGNWNTFLISVITSIKTILRWITTVGFIVIVFHMIG